MGKGWHGNTRSHKRVGKKGGQTTAQLYGPFFYSIIGRKGGRVSKGNFSHDPLRAQRVGRKGGRVRQKKVLSDLKEFFLLP